MLEPQLTADQQELIGRAVNFNTSVAEAFATRVSTYTDYSDGSFNQNDRMRIFRNYYENGAWSPDEAYRTYRYVYEADQTTGIELGKNWLPEKGRQGYDKNADGNYATFIQTENDSLTWENGKTIRFRAWSQSNYHNVLNGTSKTYFYPDFCYADYVNASGPSTSIPMVLRHLGTRFWFRIKESGNEFSRVELASYMNHDGSIFEDAWKDYKYADNADTNANDNTSYEAGKTDEEAQAECNAVTAVFMRMCMPAGVDITTGNLMAVKNSWWNSDATSDADIKNIEDKAGDNFIKYNTQSYGDIASNAKRPFFSIINGYPFMITIPYDMSNDTVKQGEVLTLPACTRFRVYLRDVNSGDEYGTSGYEGKYHIFALSDVKNTDGTQAFPNGLKLGAGLSYTFYVGYRYEGLYVVVDNNLSWEQQNLNDGTATNASEAMPSSTASDYTWWKNAIHDAIPKGTEDFKPEFHITNEKQFLEFINLVNGTATTATSGLYLLERTVNGTTTKQWSTVNSIYKPNWVTETDMEAQGYIFYDHYYAANADKAAYSERDYIKGAYPFYDDNLRRNFTVKLDADLDLKDWSLESIGKLAETPFMGCFDGQGHTIKNLYLKEEDFFMNVNGNGTEHASITNLKIESTHNTCLVGTGINQIYIAGISLYAPSSTNSIAHSLSMAEGVTGTSYVVGCIHVGDATGALVGSASNVNMFGCMQAAHGITGGALVGNNGAFTPQVTLSAQKAGSTALPTFQKFIANYYDKEISPSANAVGTTTDNYSLQEYIRGSRTDILRAKNDYLTSKVSIKQLLARSDYANYYGLAPWRAMNYAIYWYNTYRGEKHPCTMHFENNTTGYAHHYPVLLSGTPDSKYTSATVVKWNPVEQTN